MASTEEKSNSASHPPYPEMIRAAIATLGEKDGSNKSSITKYIEATYASTLPEGYTAAISETLAKLKESGDLLFANDLYMKPQLTSPPRRGRGRPRKPKPTLLPGASAPTPRPRGRPPKLKGSQSSMVKIAGGIPHRRGRPPKLKGTNGAVVKTAGGTPRSRGRPPKKHRPAVSAASRILVKGDGTAAVVSGVKRGRGRPPKVKQTVGDAVAE